MGTNIIITLLQKGFFKMKINDKNIWEIYSPVYAKITPTMQKSLLLHAAINAQGSVLDAGTGVGKLLPYLKSNKNVTNVLGIDANSFMLKESKKHENTMIKTKIEDVLNHAGKYDTIVSLNVLYTLSDPIKFLKNSYNNLNENGKLIISSPTKLLDMQKLTTMIDFEFSSSTNIEFKEEYKLFKDCNFYLASLTGFKPKLFDIEDMIVILEDIGYKINQRQMDYLNLNFTIVASK